MLPALRTGFADAARRAPLIVVFWQVNLLFGAVIAGLTATALVFTLDASWFTRSMLPDIDPIVFFTLFSRHAATYKLLGATAVMLAVLYLAGWLLLHGALVASVCGEENLGVRDSLRAGAGVLPLFLVIGLLATVVFAVLIGGIVAATFAGMRFASNAAAPTLWEFVLGTGVSAVALAWVFCGAVHDHARIRCFARGQGPVSSYLWAIGFVTRPRRRAYPLALVLFAAGVLLTVFYQSIASQISGTWMTGIVVSILWGQAMLLTRSLFRVWALAAEARLQGESGEQRG